MTNSELSPRKKNKQQAKSLLKQKQKSVAAQTKDLTLTPKSMKRAAKQSKNTCAKLKGKHSIQPDSNP